MSRHRVARAADLWSGELVGVCAGGRRVVLLNVEGEIRAYEDRCPHRGFPLSEGRLDGATLTCRAHEWVYDARTGAGLNPRSARLCALPVAVDGGDIYIEVTSSEGSAMADSTTDAGGPARAAGVGPVLEAGTAAAAAVVTAIRRLNPDVEVIDRGSYLRVLAPRSCRVTRAAVEEALGAPFRLPGELERLMPSFRGRLSITEDEVRWEG